MGKFGIDPYRLSRDIFAPVSRIRGIFHDRRKISANTSIRLGRYFGVSERFFLDPQSDIDIRNAKPIVEAALLKIQPAVL